MVSMWRGARRGLRTRRRRRRDEMVRKGKNEGKIIGRRGVTEWRCET